VTGFWEWSTGTETGKQGTVKKLAFLYASRESKATGNRKVMSNELKPELSSAYH